MASSPAWGHLALVVDTSAWMRADDPEVIERWEATALAGRFRISPVVRLEILFATRDGVHFDAVADRLSVLSTAPLTRSVARAAEAGMRALASRSAGAHRIPIADYFLAATAQESGAAVLHYDHDYDTLAEVMEFESIWLAPPGSMP
jgi:predicted nucleic acid-binding protein